MNPWVQWKIGPLNERKLIVGGPPTLFSTSMIMGGRVIITKITINHRLHHWSVGGWTTPFEKICSFLHVEVGIKHVWNHHLILTLSLYPKKVQPLMILGNRTEHWSIWRCQRWDDNVALIWGAWRNTPPRFNMEPPEGISFSMGWFSGSMLAFRGVKTLKIETLKGNLKYFWWTTWWTSWHGSRDMVDMIVCWYLIMNENKTLKHNTSKSVQEKSINRTKS